ncbi:MAG: replication initiation factor domain-containing protein [Thiolinea sp.]
MQTSNLTPESCAAASERLKARQDAAFNPPYCNTGGYDSLFEKSKILNSAPCSDLQITAIDWLRVTTSDLAAFTGTMDDLLSDDGLLAHAGLDVRWKDKGLHGYDKSASIMVWKDNDYLTVGNIGTSEQGRNRGGLLELTGTGCKILQLEYPALWLELFDLLQYHEWRISRADVALDLSGEYAKANGYTVPVLFKQAVNAGLLQSDNLRNPNMKQSFSTAGDWSDLVVGNLTPENYDPIEHCPAGLTAYIGNRKSSDDFWRIYEKGKELLGQMAEPESIDRGWIRIEHEMSRKASGREIPLDVMLRPDEYFCAGRSGARAIMDKLRADMHQLKAAHQWQREQFIREKGLLLSKKIHWAKHSYGRLFRTLVEQGIDAAEIIDWLSREDGLKEFVFDITDTGRAEPYPSGLEVLA